MVKVGDAKQQTDSKWIVSPESLIGEKHVSWKDLRSSEKVEHVLSVILKLLALVFIIFTFICTLGLLSDAFKIIGGRGIGNAVKNSKFIQNPISASIIGMVITLVLQSGSTLISILVAMVAAGLLTVHQAVPIMLGSEIGASFMNALISLGQSGNRDQFRRAFAAATMNDIYNFLCYITVLPVEIAFGVVERIGAALVEPLTRRSTGNFETLTVLTDPVLRKIIEVDDEAINNFAISNGSLSTSDEEQTFVLRCINLKTKETLIFCPYEHIFRYSLWSDAVIGVILLSISVMLLVFCLIGIVKLMQALLAGHVAVMVRRLMSQECLPPFEWLTNYIVMLFGCAAVMVIQSSSVFRSALTPLVGIGVITLDRMYPLILGSNVGTTTTGVLAALSADPSKLRETMQIALCQTVYNILGILIFYPIPQMRVPIPLAMKLGDTVVKYRWFALVYILNVFFLIPGFLLVLSLLPSTVMISICGTMFFFFLTVALINVCQVKCRKCLPPMLQTWDFLPLYMRSLRPYDKFMCAILGSIPFCRTRFVPSAESQSQTTGSEVADDGAIGHYARKASATSTPEWDGAAVKPLRSFSVTGRGDHSAIHAVGGDASSALRLDSFPRQTRV